MAEVCTYIESELTDSQIESIVTLTNSIWPKEELTLRQRIDQTIATIRDDSRATINPIRFVIWDGGQAIAHALVFDRLVRILDATDKPTSSINVLALAAVCSDAKRRGQGLGLAVVKAAFEQIGDQKPLSLFQTGVPQFYEKLGGRIVNNQFVNLLNDKDQKSNPWWDKEVMIVPGNYEWPEGRIDLNGAGY